MNAANPGFRCLLLGKHAAMVNLTPHLNDFASYTAQ